MNKAVDDLFPLNFSKLVLKTGDTLVVSADLVLTYEEKEFIKDSVRQALPDGVGCLILDKGMKLNILENGIPE